MKVSNIILTVIVFDYSGKSLGALNNTCLKVFIEYWIKGLLKSVMEVMQYIASNIYACIQFFISVAIVSQRNRVFGVSGLLVGSKNASWFHFCIRQTCSSIAGNICKFCIVPNTFQNHQACSLLLLIVAHDCTPYFRTGFMGALKLYFGV